MALSSPGIGSGLDVNSIVTSLVNADISPLQTRLDKQLASVNTKISAMGTLKSSLSSLQTSLKNLSSISSIYALQATISDSSYFSVTSTSQAVAGSYQVEVKQLAQKQSVATGYISNPADVGSGTINIAIGKYNADKSVFTPSTTKSIVIAPGSDSLSNIRDAINNQDAGVTASIVTDDSGSRLTLTSAQTGENYAMQITTSGGALDALKYDPTNTGIADGFSETIAAQNSQVKINGLLLTQSTNQIQNAITGVTLNLTKAAPGTIVSLGLNNNQSQVTSLINDFITKYNSTMTTLNTMTTYNPTTQTGGAYQSDSQLRSLRLSLSQTILNTTSSVNPNIKTLADLGISNDNQGLLQLDQTRLNTVLANNYQEIGTLFAKTATATDNNVKVTSVGSSIKAGSYDLVLSSYVPGSSVSGTINGLSTTSSGTTLSGIATLDGLSLNITGGSTGPRGQIQITDGLAVVASNFLDSYLNSGTGTLDQTVSQLQQQVKTLGKTQDQINQKQTSLQKTYMAQYSALDVLLTQMQSTSSALNQQLTALRNLNPTR